MGLVAYPDLSNPTTCGREESCKISSLIVDASGIPIMGANIRHTNNSAIGTITNYDGVFSIAKPVSDTITISYVGYKSKTLPAGNLPSKIVLEEDVTALNEVVVIGDKKNTKLLGFGLLGFLLLFAVLKPTKEKKTVKAKV